MQHKTRTCCACAEVSSAPAQEYQWIAAEQQFFGRPGSNYDWAATDPSKAFEEQQTASQLVEQLDKKVNRKVRQDCAAVAASPGPAELTRLALPTANR